MATAYNSEVKVYKRVPLAKNGTEVLFLESGAAESALASFLYKTFSQYYYTRENRGAIQVDDPIGDLEGINYVSFANMSHGGKIYFGFVDRLVYINDNNTEIQFTVDPFPTFLNECVQLKNYFVVRNTPKTDVRGANLQKDYYPSSERQVVQELSAYSVNLSLNEVYFMAPGSDGYYNITGTGIYLHEVTDQVLEEIGQKSGVIIGAYMCAPQWLSLDIPQTRDLGILSGNPLTAVAGFTHNKIRTGVYNSVQLMTPQGGKTYKLENFADPSNVQFQLVGLMMPSPAVFAYPLNYNGIIHNIGEGVITKTPAIPITANSVYTNAQAISDLTGMVGSVLTGMTAAALASNPLTAAAGFAASTGAGLVNLAGKVTNTEFSPATLYGTGEPVVTLSGEMRIALCAVHPDIWDLNRIDEYFDYYGYAVNAQNGSYIFGSGGPNLENDAYIQTGSEMFAGSEAADELNARMNAGVKIKKTLQA